MVSEVRPKKEQSQQDLALDLYLSGLLTGSGPDVASEKIDKVLALQPEPAGQPEAIPPEKRLKQEAIVEESGTSLPAGGANQDLVADKQLRAPELKLLTLKVGKLTLATPLESLSGAISFVESVSTLPNQPDWFLGLFQYKGAKVAIADMGKLVNQSQSNYKRSLLEKPYSSILLLKGGKWSVACDEIGEVICRPRKEIKWREQKGEMPWLLGTVLKPQMALIDMRSLIPICTR